MYASNENFVLPLSHDEVVHGKGSLINKMPGDDWQKFANLRLLFGWMHAQPGKKLLFMGDEFGQWREWNHDTSLDWHLLDEPLHQGLRRWVRDLNTAYRGEPALHQLDFRPEPASPGPTCTTAEQSVISLFRKGDERRRDRPDRVQLHAGAAAQLPDRRAARRLLAGDPQFRRAALRRQRPGQYRRRPHHARRLARALPVGQRRPAAAGDGRPEMDGAESVTTSGRPTRVSRPAHDPKGGRCTAMAKAVVPAIGRFIR